MNEEILQMARAHLQNVSVQRDRLMTERASLTKKIEEIEEFLKKGLQTIADVAKVDSKKPSRNTDDMTDEELEDLLHEMGIAHPVREEVRKSRSEAKNRHIDRMPPTSMPFNFPVNKERT